MRFKGYWRKVSPNSPEFILFDESHYREAGVGYSPSIGMPVLEAYQLVNKWNMAEASRNRFRYWLQ